MAVTQVQTSFRVRTDATAAQGGTPVWAAAQNTNPPSAPSLKRTIIFSNADIFANVNEDAGWGGYNVATILLAANFTADTTDNNIRCTLKFGPSTTNGSTLDECWIGAQGTGNAYNFDGTQVQLFFNGLASVTFAGGAQILVSDFIPYTVFTNTKNLVMRMHFTGTTIGIETDGGGLSNLGAVYLNGTSQAGATTPTGTWSVESSSRGFALMLAEMISAFRIRFAISSTGTTTNTSNAFQIYVSRNGGAYAAVTASTAFVQLTDATAGASANQSFITTSLLTGTGTFLGGSSGVGGEYVTVGSSASLTITHGDYSEFEYGLKFTAAVVFGDTYDFRVYFNNIALTTYTVTPRISIPITARKLQQYLRR